MDDLDPEIKTIEEKSFEFCETNDEPGLSWDEVSSCIDEFGHYFSTLQFPSEDDFNIFDANNDGVLFFEEWLQTLQNLNE